MDLRYTPENELTLSFEYNLTSLRYRTLRLNLKQRCIYSIDSKTVLRV